ncbi:HAD family hydrolase [Streptacidiphilus albus]|jgi:HAD superfamily hydrolase (TIGR01549 family)|uniref:HAD family hydrolase n=1 Tax=Streptacidiphilus albus TaxID=105425 RepID=UPI00054C40F4|nr:HAD family hydrolase [Streptacidiphilus albus]
MISAVVFDVGETLTYDRRFWGGWADWLDVPHHTLSALVGAVVAQGRDNAEALRLIRPGIDVRAEYEARERAGRGEQIADEDLYPDVRRALAGLRELGLWVGVAGNQTVRVAELLRKLELPADAVATSGEWGVAKPQREFYEQVAAWAGRPPSEILYVGDHPQNDIIPARAAGLRTAHLRRGPWGYLYADTGQAAQADWRIDSLDELPILLAPA